MQFSDLFRINCEKSFFLFDVFAYFFCTLFYFIYLLVSSNFNISLILSSVKEIASIFFYLFLFILDFLLFIAICLFVKMILCCIFISDTSSLAVHLLLWIVFINVWGLFQIILDFKWQIYWSGSAFHIFNTKILFILYFKFLFILLLSLYAFIREVNLLLSL